MNAITFPFPLLYLRRNALEDIPFHPDSDEMPWGIKVGGLLIARRFGTMNCVAATTYDNVEAFAASVTFGGGSCRLPKAEDYRQACALNPWQRFNAMAEALRKADVPAEDAKGFFWLLGTAFRYADYSLFNGRIFASNKEIASLHDRIVLAS